MTFRDIVLEIECCSLLRVFIRGTVARLNRRQLRELPCQTPLWIEKLLPREPFMIILEEAA